MQLLCNVVLIFLIVDFGAIFAQNVTIVDRKAALLTRRKRAVRWPKGSNFVINFTCSKPLLRYQPLTWNTVYEMDVPFAASTDDIFFGPKGMFKKMVKRRDVAERQNLLDHLGAFMTTMGFDGEACIQRLQCESNRLIAFDKHSMFRDLIKILLSIRPHEEDNGVCDVDSFLKKCPISLLSIFANLATDKESFVETTETYGNFLK